MAPERGKDRDSRTCLPGAPEHCSRSFPKNWLLLLLCHSHSQPNEETNLASRLSITSWGAHYCFKTVKYKSRDSCEQVAHNCTEGKGGWFRQRCVPVFKVLLSEIRECSLCVWLLCPVRTLLSFLESKQNVRESFLFLIIQCKIFYLCVSHPHTFCRENIPRALFISCLSWLLSSG